MKSSDLFDAMAKIDENITDASEQAHAVPEASGKKKIFGHAAGLAALAAGIVLFGLITAVVVNLLPGLVGGGAPDSAETGRLSITDPNGGVPTSFSGISDDTEFGCPVFRTDAAADVSYDVNCDGTPDFLFSEQPAEMSAGYSGIGWIDGKTGEKNLFDGLSGGGISFGIAFAEDDKDKTTPLLYDERSAVITWNSECIPGDVYYIPLGKLVIRGGEARIESYYVPGEDEKDCDFVEFAGVKLWKPEYKGRCANAALASGGGVLSVYAQLEVPLTDEATSYFTHYKVDESENALELLNALTSDEEVYLSSTSMPSDAVLMSAAFIYTVKNGEGEKYYFCGQYTLYRFIMTSTLGTPYEKEMNKISPAFFGKICKVFDIIFPGVQTMNDNPAGWIDADDTLFPG